MTCEILDHLKLTFETCLVYTKIIYNIEQKKSFLARSKHNLRYFEIKSMHIKPLELIIKYDFVNKYQH